jgi:hypothetical protein
MNQQREPATVAREHLARIEEQVRRRLAGRMYDLHLAVINCGLILRGHAQTYYTKQLAQHAVMETTDLPIRANEIEVS